MKNALIGLTLLSALAAGIAGGCSNYRSSGGEDKPQVYLADKAKTTLDEFKRNDPTLSKFFDKATAYAVFPEVAKGAAGIGAASGEGVVYQNGAVVGYATLDQVTVGAQLGGQSFSELVFFQDAATFSNFKAGKTEFSANTSAVFAKSGAGAANDYAHGVAVFVIPRAGAMLEASIGGQKFKFRAAN
jgi:hypothetical protein